MIGAAHSVIRAAFSALIARAAVPAIAAVTGSAAPPAPPSPSPSGKKFILKDTGNNILKKFMRSFLA
jgi:hypothetical protein